MNVNTASPVKSLVRTRLPTEHGEFVLHYFANDLDDKEHLALVKSAVQGRTHVPVRIHSECITGDVFGSRRCDCGAQLQQSLQIIERHGFGILIYLRQEGRGIGLLKKLKSYNLQDEGLDTVEANIKLGHQPDERDYRLAKLILRDLGINSVCLITNNPDKINALKALGIRVEQRLPVETGYHADNLVYLKTKAEKMSHWLNLKLAAPVVSEIPQELTFIEPFLDRLRAIRAKASQSPFFTLSYAQSIDGSISRDAKSALSLSGASSLKLTHLLRANHDALLIGINTALVDNPSLNVRHVSGMDPQPIILDCQLRFPEDAKMLSASSKLPIIVTTELAPEEKKLRLESKGIRIYRLPQTENGHIELTALQSLLADLDIRTVMIEGGGEIINDFLQHDLIDYCVITIAPKLIGGLHAIEKACAPLLEIENCQYHQLDNDLIAFGAIARHAP